LITIIPRNRENMPALLRLLSFSIAAQTSGQPPSKVKERVKNVIVVGCGAAAAAAPISQPSPIETFRVLYHPSLLPLLLPLPATACDTRSQLDLGTTTTSFSSSSSS
ncbi:unnamed protein product, partial [Laminaria digitata]